MDCLFYYVVKNASNAKAHYFSYIYALNNNRRYTKIQNFHANLQQCEQAVVTATPAIVVGTRIDSPPAPFVPVCPVRLQPSRQAGSHPQSPPVCSCCGQPCPSGPSPQHLLSMVSLIWLRSGPTYSTGCPPPGCCRASTDGSSRPSHFPAPRPANPRRKATRTSDSIG